MYLLKSLLVFVIITSTICIMNCGPSVSEEFPKFDSEYQTIIKSKEWHDFLANYNILKSYHQADGNLDKYKALFDHYKFSKLKDNMIADGNIVKKKFDHLILTVKNS